jgi:hypothetical protein
MKDAMVCAFSGNPDKDFYALSQPVMPCIEPPEGRNESAMRFRPNFHTDKNKFSTVWKYFSNRMEKYFQPYGNFLPTVWKFTCMTINEKWNHISVQNRLITIKNVRL